MIYFLNFSLNKIFNINIFVLYALVFLNSFDSYSQVENSKRKIELLPPMSAVLKNLKISPNKPNYFSILKKS